MNGYSSQNPDDKYCGLDLWMVSDIIRKIEETQFAF